MNEHEIQNQIIEYLKQVNCTFFRFNGGRKGYVSFYRAYENNNTDTKGIPDILVLKQGRCIGLEIKTKTGKQSVSQIKIEKWIKKHGGEYFLVRSLNDVIERVNLK